MGVQSPSKIKPPADCRGAQKKNVMQSMTRTSQQVRQGVLEFIGNSDGFPMKQKGCALARMVDVALQPCSARKVFKPLMIEGDGGVDVGLPTLFFGTAYEYGK